MEGALYFNHCTKEEVYREKKIERFMTLVSVEISELLQKWTIFMLEQQHYAVCS